MMNKPAHTQILLIEDNPDDAFLFIEVLGRKYPNEFNVIHISTLEKAELDYKSNHYDVALLDMTLPGLSGVRAIEKFQADCPRTPLIVLTGMDDDTLALQAVQKGCQDYLVKGKNEPEVIKRSIRYAIERKSFEDRLIQLAHYDRLTGLVNRELFHSRLTNAINIARQGGKLLAVLFIDLDGFKDINDSLGHQVGDRLLKEVSARLKGCVRDQDTIGRFGGDEFVILTEGLMASEDGCLKVVNRIINSVSEAFSIDDKSLHIACNVGIAMYPSCGDSADVLLKNADTAMHSVKHKGKNLYNFYTESLNQEISEKVALENALRNAIEHDQLAIHYQPLVDIASGRVEGVEALLRWQHPEMGMVSPMKFIPLAEQTGLIIPIGRWVMQKACSEYKKLSKLVKQPFHISVNVSAAQLEDRRLLQNFSDILKESSVSPRHIALELTESVIMDDPQKAIEIFSQFKALGMQIFVDDFGTGYSSLSYLSKLPIDVLKVDRSFVKDIASNDSDRILAKAIITLAHSLNLNVISEGVENKQQLDCLRDFGSDKAQGYYFAKPMPLDSLCKWLQTGA